MTKRLVLLLVFIPGSLFAQVSATSPSVQFGFEIGADYQLINYTQAVEYLEKLDQESDRLALRDIGETAEGRRMVMAIITSGENHRGLDRYRTISERLARAEGLDDDAAVALAREGKAVVWINGGLHADEVVGAQQLVELVYRLVSGADDETLRILQDVIVLACLVNPDGMELASNWYMRESAPERRTMAGLPRLYQKYAGHDNNRDFYMSALPETQAINRVLYREWFPQIVYDHHQSAPPGTVMFAPPFRDPFNFNFDPLIPAMIDEVGAAMQSRFLAEGKPGVTSRSGAAYSTWWNGGLRTTPYFHNMIGLLTEIIGHPTPIQLPFVASRQLPGNDLPFPAQPQTWRFRQSIEYAMTANRAVLDYASRNKDRLLFNIYAMGRNSIERGSRDSWTVTPDVVFEARTAADLKDPARRDPRAYVIPSDQADFLTATKFINTLVRSGITVHRGAGQFEIHGKTYPAGSFVVRTAQAFRPHILDMFEPQDYPDDFAYPGAPPTPPYDSAGWTLAFQMGVKFDRILDGFGGSFEPVSDEVKPAPGVVLDRPGAAGYLFSHQTNDSFIAINRLLQSGETVSWLNSAVVANGRTWPAGTNFIAASANTLGMLRRLASELGLTFEAVESRPDARVLPLRETRLALWDGPGGSIQSGWTRLVLENFEFPFTVVEGERLQRGDLKRAFDVIILPNDRTLSPDVTAPLKSFLEDGGVVIAVGQSTALAFQLNLPIASAVSGLTATELFIPGSVLRAAVDTTHPIGFGAGESVDVFFDRSPVFRIEPGARNVRSILWFDSERPLRSGWAWGQQHLKDAAAAVEVSIGRGRLVLFGPEISFRAQPHGVFKLLFNAIYNPTPIQGVP